MTTARVSESNRRASNDIAAHTLAFLKNGGEIELLSVYDRNEGHSQYNNQNENKVIAVRCDRILNILRRRGFKDAVIRYQPKLKEYYYSLNGEKLRFLAVKYEHARYLANRTK